LMRYINLRLLTYLLTYLLTRWSVLRWFSRLDTISAYDRQGQTPHDGNYRAMQRSRG